MSSMFPPNIKNHQRKRHSLANITDIWNKYQGHHTSVHRVTTLPGLRGSGTSVVDTPLQQGCLESIQLTVVHLFQKKQLPHSFSTIQANIRRLIQTDAGPLIYDYFKDQLLKKGMVILRESMKNLKGSLLLEKLSDIWDYFFKEVLPTLQALLYPLQDGSLDDVKVSVRQVTLAEFRDTVLLKINLEEALESPDIIPQAIKQMLLVLQGVQDSYSLEQQLKLEKLVVQVIQPYLGVRGLYVGGPEPVVASLNYNIPEKEKDVLHANSDRRPVSLLPDLKLFQSRHANKLNACSFLAPVDENDSGRRYSLIT